MMNRGFVGRVCVAIGICLVLLSYGAYQAHAGSCGNEVCETGTCAGIDTNSAQCSTGTCTGYGISCWNFPFGCQCQKNIFLKNCECTN
jgi:hypothetical protein